MPALIQYPDAIEQLTTVFMGKVLLKNAEYKRKIWI